MSKKAALIALLTILIASSGLFAAEGCTAVAAEKPDFTLTKLKFETVDKAFTDFGSMKPHGMKYIARCNIDTGMRFGSSGSWRTSNGRKQKNWFYLSGYGERILKTPTGMKLSAKQKDLIAKGYDIVMLKSDSGMQPIYALGTNEEQAKNTAIAFLECLNDTAKKHYDSTAKVLPEFQKKYDKAVKDGQPYPDKVKAATEQYEKKQQETYYQNKQEALAAITRMSEIVETYVIDQSVLQAKLKVVKQELEKEYNLKKAVDSSKYGRQPLILDLEKNRVEITMDLAQVEATLEAANKIRTNANLFIKYERELSSIQSSHSRVRKMINSAHHELSKLKKSIADPPKSHQPTKILDNTIIIQPIN